MKTLLRSLGSLAVALALSTSATAQVGVGAHVGYDVEFENAYFGVNSMFQIPMQAGERFFRVNPEFSYYLIGDQLENVDGVDANSSAWLLAVNLIYPFGLEAADFYGGVGLEVARVSASVDLDIDPIFDDFFDELGSSSTDFGVNLKIGAAIRLLFAEIGYHIRSGGGPYAQGGIRATLGGG